MHRMLRMIRRYDPRRQIDALKNRSVFLIVLFSLGIIYIVYTQTIVEHDLAPDLHRYRILHKEHASMPNYYYYETWDWAVQNFSDFAEYQSFIGRIESNFTAETPWDTHQFSVDTSDSIEVNRLVPDTRHFLCSVRHRRFNERTQTVRNTSVIITFYNESASALLRTIVSVLRNTPSKLLGEIILVDDGSPNCLNSTFLQRFHRKIKYKRNTRREGVIASRSIAGKLLANGQFIVFLDSHCEVNVGWLEPLLERLVLNPGTVVSPVIDVIDSSSFEYKLDRRKMDLKGGFDWSLEFRWFPMSIKERYSRRDGWNRTLAYASPITAGGIFAISRQVFLELGGFSNMLQTWGGESIEFSLRVWMCGGHVEIVPCSRIGHVFRKKLPYDLPLGIEQTKLLNSRFIAELWLSNYKSLFYEHRPAAKNLSKLTLHSEVGLISRLQCHTFRWYLENVYQELIVSSRNYTSLGQIIQDDRCVILSENPFYSVPVLSICNSKSITWIMQRNGLIVVESNPNHCMTVVANVVVISKDCTEPLQTDQLWMRINNTIVHRDSGRCLDVLYDSAQRLVLNECRVKQRRSQIWHFTVDHIINAMN